MKVPRVREVKKRNKPCEKPVRVQSHLTFMYRTHKEICPVNSKFPGVPRRLPTAYCQQVGLEAARLSKMNRRCVISLVEVRSALETLQRGQHAV